MASQTVAVLCAKCHVPPEGVAEREAEDWFACPECGTGDTRQNVIREAMDHAKEVAARSIQESARGVARRSKFIKFQGKPIPKGNYRFISDLKL